MGIVNGISIVNNLIAGSMTGEQLQTYLATGANLASFVQVINVRRQLQVLRNTPAAVTAVTASATASATVAANDTALRQWLLYGTSYNWRSFANAAAVMASAPAMAGVVASAAAMSVITASATAMQLVAKSATARAAVAANPAAFAAVNANDQALRIWILEGTGQNYEDFANLAAVMASGSATAAIAASSDAMARIVASPVAKMALFNSDVALNAFKASATAMSAMRGAAGYGIQSNTLNGSAVAIPGLAAGGSYILLGYSKSSTALSYISAITTVRSGSALTFRMTAYTTPSSVTAQQADVAVPLVAPFSSNGTGNITWYYGLLRCDV